MSSVPTSPPSIPAANSLPSAASSPPANELPLAAQPVTPAAAPPAAPASLSPPTARPSATAPPHPPQTEDPRRWQRQLATAIRSRQTLLQRLGLSDHPQLADGASIGANCGASQDANTGPHASTPVGEGQNAHTAEGGFGTLVPESYLQRMVPGDPEDPLLRQVLVDPAEQQRVEGFVADPVDDASARTANGLLHKYRGRVLLITTGACAVHCRYCFRRNYPYHAEPKQLADWQPALDYIAAHADTTEVILSGGDPLTLTDDRLTELCRAIDSIPHVQRIRFHTRLPIVLPARINDALLSGLLSLRSQPIMVVHANHGQEIQADCRAALQLLVRSGVVTLNQAVLLAGVNDSVEALAELSQRLVNIGVMPYYLHQLDRVAGAAHFETDPRLGLELVAALAEQLPGYAVPRLVKEVAGAASKTPVEKLSAAGR